MDLNADDNKLSFKKNKNGIFFKNLLNFIHLAWLLQEPTKFTVAYNITINNIPCIQVARYSTRKLKFLLDCRKLTADYPIQNDNRKLHLKSVHDSNFTRELTNLRAKCVPNPLIPHTTTLYIFTTQPQFLINISLEK